MATPAPSITRSLCALATLAGAAAAAAQDSRSCEPNWSSRFHSAVPQNNVGHPPVLTTFNFGGAPALAIGSITSAAGLQNSSGVVVYDGHTFNRLGPGLSGWFRAFTAGGPGMSPLFAAGTLDVPGPPTSVRVLAEWDGSTWHTHDLLGAVVYDIAIHDDGAGPALYITGLFSQLPGTLASGIAKWDGAGGWHALGSGLGGTGTSMVSLDDGAGAALYVTGSFSLGTGGPGDRLARWVGPVGPGGHWEPLPVPPGTQTTWLAAHDDGSGARLYSLTSTRVGRLDPGGWTTIGNLAGGYSALPMAIASVETRYGQRLAIGGSFLWINGMPIQHTAQWDGEAWSRLGGPLADSAFMPGFIPVTGIASYDDGSGPHVYISGEFRRAGELGAWNIARSDGEEWVPFGLGMSHGVPGGTSNASQVSAFAVHDDGSGAAIYAGGSFYFAGSRPAGSLAKFTGDDWVGINPELAPLAVVAMQSFDAGLAAGGPALFIASRHSANHSLMRLQNGHLSTVPGISLVSALGVFDLPWLERPDLFAAHAARISRYNQGQWQTLGTVVGALQQVHAMAVYDDGAGEALYAGGQLQSSSSASPLLRWTGATWQQVPGVTGIVRALQTHHDDPAAAPVLYIGGSFGTAGGQVARNIARFDGGTLSPVGEGLLTEVMALTSFGDGASSALYAGVRAAATSAGMGLARWDGHSWQLVGGGTLSHSTGPFHAVLALQPFVDDEQRPTLFIGGDFGSAGGLSSHRIAQWIGCPPIPPGCYANCDGSTTEPILNVDDFLCFINRFAEASMLPHEQQVNHYANCTGSTVAPVLSIDDFTCFINAFATGCP